MTSDVIRIWTRFAHHPAFKAGGWAYVRAPGRGEPVGQAGGARDTTAQRMALAGLVAALADLPKAVTVRVDLSSPELARIARRIASGPAFAADEAPALDLDLWAQLTTALAGRTMTFELGDASFKGGPAPFAQAWADLAQDKAKASGAFVHPIPKPNLAKLILG